MITSWAPTPFIRSYIPSPRRSRPPSIWSAGNLFGTTRVLHPGPFAPAPPSRMAITSCGVKRSFPGQNGHAAPGDPAAAPPFQSEGLRARSVAMMTQRPTTGSFLSSGIESDSWSTGGPDAEGARVARANGPLPESLGLHLGGEAPQPHLEERAVAFHRAGGAERRRRLTTHPLGFLALVGGEDLDPPG